jgi:uroporphyrinogen-III decarboxylase
MILDQTGFPQIVGAGIWSVVQQLRGVQAYKDMRTNPEILLTLCEKIYRSQIDVYNNWVEKVGRSPFVFYAGYAFNATMMSYEDAMRFEGDFMKRFQKEVPFPFILHNCGFKPYWNVCDEFSVVAVNGSHPLDLEFWVDFKKKYRSISILGATIDVSRELLTGTPADIESKVKENILTLAPGGRYAVSPVCALPWNVPLPNIMAVSSAIEKYGHYPIGES